MKLGAIDIGSNAIRLQITNVLETRQGPVFKKLEYLRFPLRLGWDVFHHNNISEYNRQRFFKLMQAFKILIDLYEVDRFMGCATSAMRESENGPEILSDVKQQLGLEIELIDGETEAQMVNIAIQEFLNEKTYLHIDVGGGSTELNIYKNGEKIDTASFKIGSVRRLSKLDKESDWDAMKNWIIGNTTLKKVRVTAVGTGGNINKYYDLSGKKQGNRLSLKKLEELKEMVSCMSESERLLTLQLNPDRADVILPAADIYISVMRWVKAQSIIVPKVGLKDGIMKYLWEDVLKEREEQSQKV